MSRCSFPLSLDLGEKMKYEILKVTQIRKARTQQFYEDHFPLFNIGESLENFTHVMMLKDGTKLIGIMPIIKFTPLPDSNYCDYVENHYSLFHTVIHKDHRRQGHCNAMLRMVVKLLIDMGAVRIRVAKSSTNFVRSRIFTDMKFKIYSYKPEAPEFKYIYELNTKRVVNTWGEYQNDTVTKT